MSGIEMFVQAQPAYWWFAIGVGFAVGSIYLVAWMDSRFGP